MAGSLRVKSASVGGRLTVAGELAASDVGADVNPSVNSDVDADDGGPGKSRRSHGYQVEVGWASHPGQLRPARQPGWGLAVSHERREPSFASPLGSSTAQDFAETELSAHIGWRSVDTRLTVSQLADNVEDDGRRPTTRTRGLRGVVSWSPDADTLGNGAQILGRPSLHLRGEISEDLHTTAPAAVTATKVDRERQSVEAAASFANSHWSWDLRHRVTEAEATDAAGRRLINGSQLDVNLPMGEHVRFSPHVGYEREENRTANVHRDALNVGLTTLTSLVADSLDWKVSYRYDTNTLSDGSVDLAGHNIDTSIDWSLAPLDITFSLSGAYDYSDGRGDLSSERGSYELLAALSLTL